MRERILTTSAGFSNQSFIETIRFAAANRLRIDLQYRDLQGAVTTRTVEPYSFRRSAAGDVRLMATQEVDGAPRSFLIDRILGVSMTQRTFVPRYPIELTPSGPMVIPQTFSIAASRASRTPRRPMRRAVRSGPTYIYRCPVCHKKLSRKTHDPALRPHKNKSGRDCYGRHGIYVRTKH